MSHLTEADHAQLAEDILHVLDRLLMSHWRIYVSDEPAQKGAYASVNPATGRYCAKMRVCKKWRALPRRLQQECVLHEVLHCLLHQSLEAAHTGMKQNLKPAVYDVWTEQLHDHHEFSVDHLTNVMYPYVWEVPCSSKSREVRQPRFSPPSP